MAYEKASSNTRSPAMPTVARAVNKPPLTPKVATRAPTLQTPNPPITTPLPRRTTRPDLPPGSNGTFSRDKDEMASPVSAFLTNNNITPRSGSRQVRVDSASSTPTGTPTLERHDSWENRAGLGIPGFAADDMPRRPTVTFGPSVDMGNSRQDADSKFFYASDAQKPAQQPVPVKPTVVQPRPATFFYANGETVPPKGVPSQSPLTPTLAVSAPGLDPLETKFVYANGTPNPPPLARTSAVPSTAPAPIARTNALPATNQAPAAPTTSRIPTSRPSTAGSHTSPRPSSPVKQYPPSKLMRSPIVTTNPQGGPLSHRAGRPGGAHARSSSMASNLTMAEPPAVARLMSAHGSVSSADASPSIGVPSPTFATFPGTAATAGFASLLQAAEDFAEDEDEAAPESLNSPTKSPSQEKELTDLVVSARRERKVQDLEITNASLEAINRTLERQLRKQTAEIRRFKRLSRSGRLSMGSMGTRVASNSSVDGGALARAGMDLDDLSEEESEMDAQDEEMESEEEDLSDSEASSEHPATTALRDARHRQNDERRLQLDLSKHQQLLVDSQKINQSLKRCLGWTEELIKEGKRALAYQVRVSEVELGGRVLAPEDIEARERREARDARLLAGEDAADLSCDDRSAVGSNFLDLESFPDDTGSELWSKDGQDRDSGIELPTDGG